MGLPLAIWARGREGRALLDFGELFLLLLGYNEIRCTMRRQGICMIEWEKAL
jgi:hypothetical protein